MAWLSAVSRVLAVSMIIMINNVNGYLYMSTHDSPFNYLAIDSMSGKVISESVLNIADLHYSTDNLAWRGLGYYNDSLYVVNSKKGYSFIGQYECVPRIDSGEQSTLELQRLFTVESDGSNDGLDHPYELGFYTLATNGEFGLLTSTQNTNAVLLYDKEGNPYVNRANSNLDYPGAIIEYSDIDSDENGVRGMAVDQELSLLFVCVEYYSAVFVYDISGIPNENPPLLYKLEYQSDSTFIGVRLDVSNQIAYAGDSGNDAILAFKYDRNSYSTLWLNRHLDDLNHPAGIALINDDLFVVSQNENKILQFNTKDGSLNRTLLDFDNYDILGENLFVIQSPFLDSSCSNF